MRGTTWTRGVAGLLAMSVAACSSVVQGADNRDVGTLTLAQPTIEGSPLGVSCGWSDDDVCRPGLVCGPDWVCIAREPPPEITCSGDAQCPSDEPSCNGGVCAPLGNEGDRCSTSATCQPGFLCSVGGACRSIRTWCTSTSGCPANDICEDNACTPRW